MIIIELKQAYVRLIPSVELTVYGTPKTKGRPRMTRYGRTYTPKETVEYENLVRDTYRENSDNTYFDEDVPVKMTVLAYFRPAKHISKKKRKQLMEENYCINKKDIDNISKTIMDALNKTAYDDDAQVSVLEGKKQYSEESRVHVVIEDLRREKYIDEHIRKNQIQSV